MDNINNKYEISIWEDIFTTNDNGIQYLKEECIAIIGSNTMTSPAKAVSPSFKENINGTKTLTFTLYTNYFDEELEKKVTNPFIKLLVNERKIKLKEIIDGKIKWHDLIISDIQENSEDNSFVYSATDLHINELSKNGFELEFDTELENNQGTIDELAEKVLEGTDWTLGKSDEIKQYKTEPLFLGTTTSQLYLVNLLDEEDVVTVPKGKYIYIFYTANTENDFQCIFNSDFSKISTTATLSREQYSPYTLQEKAYFDRITINTSVEPFQAERLVSSAKSGYDPKIDKYYTVYEQNGTIYHCYTENQYATPEAVSEIIVNGKNFESTYGWTTEDATLKYEAEILPKVTPENINTDTIFTPVLKVDYENTSQILYNTGIYVNRDKIESFKKGEVYYLLIRGAYQAGKDNYALQEEHISIVLPFSLTATYMEYFNGDLWYKITVNKQISYKELSKIKIGIKSTKKRTVYFYEVRFFKELKKIDGTVILPDSLIDLDNICVKNIYYIYNPNWTYTSIDDISYQYVGEKIPSDYKPLSNNYTKVRSISIKESNRYNILQSLAETFEAWMRIDVEHEQDGKIKVDENGKHKKRISFHNYMNDDYNYAGFKKGINLKSTNRSLVSDQIVSKLIVKNNANEFAQDGFCSVSRADENYIKENMLYNFDYYTSHNLLDKNQLFADLYNTPIKEATTPQPLGYYVELRRINLEEEPYIANLSETGYALATAEANLQATELLLESTSEQLIATQQEVYNFYGIKDYTKLKSDHDLWKNDEFLKDIAKIKNYERLKLLYSAQKNRHSINVSKLESNYLELEKKLKVLKEQKETLNKKFFSKYSRFIKEGTWISEDYYKDDLYYLDAEKVLNESAYPKITYTIQVIDISELEEFKGYHIELGEKSFIEDTDFFGWVMQEGILTPAKEEIIVSEKIRYFDEPDKNVITVQNYKSRFEELFQRITATTQNLQYHSGDYNRAAAVIESNGTINYETLQNSIEKNSLTIKNAKDQSIVIGDNGITITDLMKPNEIVRIVSGGVFLSSDGGQTYGSAIKGTGINASFMTLGQLNVERVNIISGSAPSFKWDKRGINAFWFEESEDENITQFNLNRFVRFDKFGLYGCLGTLEGDGFSPKSIEEVKENANFAVTWDGFFMRSNSTQNGYIEITNTSDLKVYQDGITRVQLGLLEKKENESNLYGLRLRNNKGQVTLETGDNGFLWLKDKLNIEIHNPNNFVQIGVLEESDAEHGNQVINATNKFIVYEDGHMKATSGEFTGTINATGGKIGNLSIGQVEQAANTTEEIRGVTIYTNEGLNFKIGNNVVTPSQITLLAKIVGLTINKNDITWSWSSDFVNWQQLTSEVVSSDKMSCIVTYEKEKGNFVNGTYYVKIECEQDGKIYRDYVTLHIISDGQTPIYIIVESQQGNIYINNKINTTLKARVMQGDTDITSQYSNDKYSWTKYDEKGTIDEEWTKHHQECGPIIQITHEDVERKANFVCGLTF